MRHARVILALAAASLAACSLLVPLDEVQCNTTADCLARGHGFAGATCVSNVCVTVDGGDAATLEAATDAPVDALTDASEAAVDAGGPWDCLQTPPGASDPSATVRVEIISFDPFEPYTLGGAVEGGTDLQIVQATPEPGVAVEPCAALDPACAHPVQSTPALTDDAGVAVLDMNGAFSGFYSMKRSDSFPTLFYPGRLLASEPSVSYPVALLPYSIASEIGFAVGIDVATSPEAGVGHIFGAVFDCFDRHVGGVSFALTIGGAPSDAGSQFYTRNGLPTTGLTETDTSGTGGWLNVPVGTVTIVPTIVGANEPALPSYTVYVQPAAETLMYLRPRVRPQ